MAYPCSGPDRSTRRISMASAPEGIIDLGAVDLIGIDYLCLSLRHVKRAFSGALPFPATSVPSQQSAHPNGSFRPSPSLPPPAGPSESRTPHSNTPPPHRSCPTDSSSPYRYSGRSCASPCHCADRSQSRCRASLSQPTTAARRSSCPSATPSGDASRQPPAKDRRAQTTCPAAGQTGTAYSSASPYTPPCSASSAGHSKSLPPPTCPPQPNPRPC